MSSHEQANIIRDVNKLRAATAGLTDSMSEQLVQETANAALSLLCQFLCDVNSVAESLNKLASEK